MRHHPPLYELHNLLYLDNYYSFMKVVGLAYASTIGKDSDMSAKSSFSHSQAADKSQPIALRGSSLSPSSSAGGKSSLTDYPEPNG